MQLISKAEYVSLARKLCDPILHYYNTEHSKVCLPMRMYSSYKDEIADMESFARPLWAIAGLVKNGDRALGETVFSMIKNGVNPSNPEFWGNLENHSQVIVELPSIVFFSFINKDIFEQLFSNEEKRMFEEWVLQINNVTYGENNWLFFALLVNSMMLNMGMSGNRDIIQKNWSIINQHYVGDGWYSDGKGKQKDYYIAFAYHFYSLLWVYIDNSIDDEICEVIKERAEKFASTYQYFFAEDGSCIAYGRSLIYRFANISFWSAYKLVGLNGVANNVVKTIIDKSFNWWLKQDIFRPDGILNIGYAYNNMFMTETYNATGSPLWAMKFFLVLLIPETDPFWDSGFQEEPNDKSIVLESAGFHVIKYQGISYLYPTNLQAFWDWETATSKYEKYVYSSKFGFCVSRGSETMEGVSCDSTIAVSCEKKHWIAKHRTEDYIVSPGVLFSRWAVNDEISMDTWLCINNAWNVRIHRIENKKRIYIIDGGFSTPNVGIETDIADESISLKSKCNNMLSIAASIKGNGICKKYNSPPNSNILYPRTSTPYVEHEVSPGKHYIIDGFYGGNLCPIEIPRVVVDDCNVVVTIDTKQYEINITEKPHFLHNLKGRFVQKIKRRIR